MVISPYSEMLPDSSGVICRLCPHQCVLRNGHERGFCRTRHLVDDHIEIDTFGRFVAAGADPIEKKPLYHFYPSSQTFSVATRGCNLICPFCQNHSLSQCTAVDLAVDPHDPPWTPQMLLDRAAASGCRSIAFTWSEPVLSLEFALQMAEPASVAGLPLIFVTNGQIRSSPRRDLVTCLGAANVDLKTFSTDAFRRTLGGDLRTTLDTIIDLHSAGVWIEITTLIIPGWNDSDAELSDIARFIADLSVDIPWHLSRFHGAWKWMDRDATPPDTLQRAAAIGKSAGLRYVYVGNVSVPEGGDTHCPACKKKIVRRTRFAVRDVLTDAGACRFCGSRIAGVGL